MTQYAIFLGYSIAPNQKKGKSCINKKRAEARRVTMGVRLLTKRKNETDQNKLLAFPQAPSVIPSGCHLPPGGRLLVYVIFINQ